MNSNQENAFYDFLLSIIFVFFLKSLPGAKTVESKKMDFNKKAKSKVNSFSNIGHVPGGGRVKVIDTNMKKKKIEPIH